MTEWDSEALMLTAAEVGLDLKRPECWCQALVSALSPKR